MKRALVMALGLAVSTMFGATVVAHGASAGSLSAQPQSASISTAQTQLGTVTRLPLLVIVTNKGDIRDIQHSQRLPNQVNQLLWSSVRNWVKSPSRVNGRQVRSQVFMDVTMHSEPQADGQARVYFTLASVGPVMRGYWVMHGDRINGPCARTTGDVNAGVGGKTAICSYRLTADVTPSPSGMPLIH